MLSSSGDFRANQKTLTNCEVFAEFLIMIITQNWLQFLLKIVNSKKFTALKLFVLLQRVKSGKIFFTSGAFDFCFQHWHCMLCCRVMINFVLNFPLCRNWDITDQIFSRWYKTFYAGLNLTSSQSIHTSYTLPFPFDEENELFVVFHLKTTDNEIESTWK